MWHPCSLLLLPPVQVNKKLEEVLTNKNSIIRALQYDVAKVSKAHNDLIRVYEAKLAEYGIPAGRHSQALMHAILQLLRDSTVRW